MLCDFPEESKSSEESKSFLKQLKMFTLEGLNQGSSGKYCYGWRIAVSKAVTWETKRHKLKNVDNNNIRRNFW